MFLIGRPTASNIISETCAVIWNELRKIYFPKRCGEDWRKISKNFYEIWNLPNCIGALDGKHVQFKCPNKSGTLYFNYKKTFSIHLMALCDGNYNFLEVDVGGFGSQNDAGVYKTSAFAKAFENNTMNVPNPNILPNTHQKFPYYIVGDEAFPLKQYIMKPYPGNNFTEKERIYNYR